MRLRKGDQVEIVFSAVVNFSEEREGRLQARFSDAEHDVVGRRKDGRSWWKEIKNLNLFKDECKIGISNDPQRRRKEIQKDLESGKTEWFLLNRIERIVVILYVLEWSIRPFVLAFLLLSLIILYLWITI